MLADVNADGKMDRREFAIAMFLIKRKLQGFELPPSLPRTLLDGSAAAPGTAPIVMGSPYPGTQPPPAGFMTSGIPVMGIAGASGKLLLPENMGQ